MTTNSQSAAQALDALAAELAAGRSVRATGAAGSFAALAIARVVQELSHERRPLLVVAPDETRAAELTRDLGFFLPEPPGAAEDPAAPPRILHLPAIETSPYAELSPDRRAIMRRLSTLFRLSQGFGGDVLVASASALARRVIPRTEFAALIDVLVAEEEIDRDATAALLARTGYSRVPVVEDPGTYARGGVIDVFPPLYRYPVRLELLGDLVESIKFFDPATQRTMRRLDEIYLLPVRETVKTKGADPRARLLEAADAAEHPSSKTRALIERVEAGEDFFGVEALAPAFHARMGSIAEYLPAGAASVVLDPEACRKYVDEDRDRFATGFAKRREEHRVVFPPDAFLLDARELDQVLERPVRTELRLIDPDASPTFHFQSESNLDLEGELRRTRAEKSDEPLRPLAMRLRTWREDGVRVVLVVGSRTHADRLDGLLRGYQIEAAVRREPGYPELARELRTGVHSLTIAIGPLAEGFRLPGDAFVLVSEDEIFGPRAHERKARTAKQRGLADFAGVADFASLVPGDHVVHSLHGVGVYKGLTKLPVRGTPIDFLHLEYEGGALYLPVYRLSEVQRYVGAEGHGPKLDRLGGLTWEKTRSKVSREVKQLAEDLLKLYAQRQALPGHAFALAPHDEALFHEFEARFPFEETEDQQKAIDAVAADMAEARPMDRLVCGDVGYGKTEVALRAALRAVLGHRQVAVLAPTTVLVEQHGVTFTERFKELPVNVATLSRFKSRAEQLEVLKRAAEGRVDVVIGTHRLLSTDVRFKELGLIVVDEEQRFGVAHKEKLKQLRTQVDVLTLTATPIPRTMHMAMMGLREISIIATPPADRRAIRTFVCRPDDEVLKEGIQRELARGGQIFFVSHIIGQGGYAPPAGGAGPGPPGAPNARGDRSLAEWAAHLRTLVPGLRVAVAHGQMDSESLEQIMVDFVQGKYDVLCSTTIIESGLDIPRANTMFVSRADHFGLAQLYQLRGRIGRSRERAYCYLMVPPMEALTPEAKQRLAVLQRFTELGAGFQIASHDLEIRGAGDLLGAKQSGQIAAVGFEMYTQILGEAVAELRGEAIKRERDPELTVDLPTYIPDDYVSDTGQRLDLYKRLSTARDEDEVRAIESEIADRYGAPPDEVRLLGELMIVKAEARKLGATAIDLTDSRLSIALADDTPLKPEKVLRLVNPGGKQRSPYRLTPDMRLVRTFSEKEQVDRLASAKACLRELLASAV